MNTTPLRLRTAAVAVTFGLTAVTGAVGLPAALDPIPAASAQINTGVAPSTIDVTRQGSITVHKRLDPVNPPGTRDDGNPNSNPGGTPRQGVTFRVEKLNANLGTNQGWQAAQNLTPTSPRDGSFMARDADTDVDGIATYSNLPVGVYVVTETGKPDSIVPTAPFLVYVPMTNPTATDDSPSRTQWNYDVHVYPKNATNAAVKSVSDLDANVGDDITYEIVADVPTPATSGGTLTKYELRDNFDWGSVTTDPSRVSATLSNGTPLVAGDYDVVAIEGQAVTVKFTPQGLTKLTTQVGISSDLAVRFQIVATVKAVRGTDGTASNSAVVTSNNGTGTDTQSSTETVETKWGMLQIAKQGREGNMPLAGAAFNLFECTNPSNAGSTDGPVRLGDTKLTVGGVSEWTTDASGSALIDGLHVTDFENSGPVSTVSKLFCLVETRAPEGYELLSRPVPVSFTRADLASTADGTDELTVRATVTNVASTQANLPLTGGKGIGILAAIGALIVGAGVWYARKASTKA